MAPPTSRRSCHLHIGAGALGLGLVCWASQRLGFRTVLVNRSSRNDARNDLLRTSRSFLVAYPAGAEPAEETVQIDDFLYVPAQEDELLEYARDPATVLLTTSLKEAGVRETAPLLGRMFAARAAAGRRNQLAFIACENAITSETAFELALNHCDERVRPDIRSAVVPAGCVVDRICNKPAIDGGRAVVVCERFARWYIARSDAIADLEVTLQTVPRQLAGTTLGRLLAPGAAGSVSGGSESKERCDSVELVAALTPYMVRKKWVVNGLHLSLAIAAFAAGHSMLHLYVQRPEVRIWFDALANECDTVFRMWCDDNSVSTFPTAEISAFVETAKERIATHPQFVTDAMTRLRRDQLLDFVKDLFRKVAEPYLLFGPSKGNMFQHLPAVLALADQLVASERFVDST